MTQSQSKPILGRHLAAVLLFIVALAACTPSGGKNLGTADIPVEEVEPTPVPEPAPTWPLTGVEAGAVLPEGSSSALVDGQFRPVLSVKIENSAGARPQGGLEHADVVWEQLVEGGMTRFVAMFHSDLPQALGPIRSVRPMDAAIAGPAGGLLVFSGGQSEYQARVQQAGLVMVSDDAGDEGFYRDAARRGDHRLFGRPEQLLGYGEGLAGPPDLFAFPADGEEPSAIVDGEEIRRVDVHFPSSNPSWEWNGEVWQRFESGLPAVAESGARLEAENVVVVRVGIRDTGNRDSAGAMVPETILDGEGEVTVFTGGRMVEGSWEKGGPTDPLVLRGAGGSDLLLAPGKTWVELLPISGASVSTAP